MTEFKRLSLPELVEQICATVGKPRLSHWSDFSAELVPTEPAPFALVVGAPFSYGTVPLVRELMHETIGEYNYPDRDQTSMRRPRSIRRTNSAAFWAERSSYVNLGTSGADGLLGSLYRSMISGNAGRESLERYRQWNSLRLGN